LLCWTPTSTPTTAASKSARGGKLSPRTSKSPSQLSFAFSSLYPYRSAWFLAAKPLSYMRPHGPAGVVFVADHLCILKKNNLVLLLITCVWKKLFGFCCWSLVYKKQQFGFCFWPDGFSLPTPLCSCTPFWEPWFPAVPYVFGEVPSVILQQLGSLSLSTL
jgi:hypothetical protein